MIRWKSVPEFPEGNQRGKYKSLDVEMNKVLAAGQVFCVEGETRRELKCVEQHARATHKKGELKVSLPHPYSALYIGKKR